MPAATSGAAGLSLSYRPREFDAAQHRPSEGRRFRQRLEHPDDADQRHVAKARLAAVGVILPIVAIDDGEIELQAEPFVEVIADKRLRTQAMQVFAVRFGAVVPPDW